MAGHSAPEIIENLPLAYVEANAQGICVYVNRLGRAMSAPEMGEIVGKFLWDMLPADQREISRAAFLAIMESGEKPPVIYRSIYTKDGIYRTYEMHRSLIHDAQGHPAGLRYVSIDVSEAQTAREEARQALQLLENVLASVAHAVIVTDALGFVRYLNPAAEELCGWKAKELTGKVIDQEFSLLSYSSSDLLSFSHRVTLERRTKGIATILDSARRPLRVEISTSPIVDKENGITTGAVAMLRRVEDSV